MEEISRWRSQIKIDDLSMKADKGGVRCHPLKIEHDNNQIAVQNRTRLQRTAVRLLAPVRAACSVTRLEQVGLGDSAAKSGPNARRRSNVLLGGTRARVMKLQPFWSGWLTFYLHLHRRPRECLFAFSR
jgi:hypothetical protein